MSFTLQRPKKLSKVKIIGDSESDDYDEDIKVQKQFEGPQDFSEKEMKQKSNLLPLWVLPDRTIFLETFSPLYDTARDFLIQIAEPVSRPQFIHKYRITKFSLFGAIALELKKDDIIALLQKLNKFKNIPKEVSYFITHTCEPYGQRGSSLIKTLLINKQYFIEAQNQAALDDIRNKIKSGIKSKINQLQITEINFKNMVDKAEKNNINYYKSHRLLALNSNQRQKAIQKLPQKKQQELKDLKRKSEFKKREQKDTLHAIKIHQQMLKDWEIKDMPKFDPIEEEKIDELEYGQKKHYTYQSQSKVKEHEKRILNFEQMFDNPEEDIDQIDNEKETFQIKVNSDTENTNVYISTIREICIRKKILMIDEYDYNTSTKECPKMDINLKFTTRLRSYQEKAISKMFASNRARSGVIVLPCGAGKTLVGIKCISKIKKRTIIFCPNVLAVDQWYREINRWSDAQQKKIRDDGEDHNNVKSKQYPQKIRIFRFKSRTEDAWIHDEPGIVITTYPMISFKSKDKNNDDDNSFVKNTRFVKESEGQTNRKYRKKIKQLEWGLAIYDEVQQLPASKFKKASEGVKVHTKLGLTATLVREDEKIIDLNSLIGPKLYEEDWQYLTNEGFLAKVQCIEIRCPLTKQFRIEHDRAKHHLLRELLYSANPNKFYTIKKILEQHKDQKILIYADKLFALKTFANKLHAPFICGEVNNKERELIIDAFKSEDAIFNTLFFSTVGDNAIDLPNAEVIIQISSHGQSRRQEAQRLGRILRPKKNMVKGRYSAYFYSLISTNTRESDHSIGRQSFLMDQGYSYDLIHFKDLDLTNEWIDNLNFSKEDLLQKILIEDYQDQDDMELDQNNVIQRKNQKPGLWYSEFRN